MSIVVCLVNAPLALGAVSPMSSYSVGFQISTGAGTVRSRCLTAVSTLVDVTTTRSLPIASLGWTRESSTTVTA